MSHSQLEKKKKKAVNRNWPRMAQMLNISDKNFKAAI